MQLTMITSEKNINEKTVTAAWQRLITTGCNMKTVNGKFLKIIYPGKNSDAPGSDFQDAVIEIDNRIVTGNIEIHVRSSDWYKHRHHRNPAYNNIVLHVVMWQDRENKIELQNGTSIDTVAIDSHPQKDIPSHPPDTVPCSMTNYFDKARIQDKLDSAGLERFLEKTSSFLNELHRKDAGECLYCGIMSALGYVHNKEPFLKLAEGLPLSVLEPLSRNADDPESKLLKQQALLFGVSGLLTVSAENSDYVNSLKSLWKSSGYDGFIPGSGWHFFRTRPSNSPLRRLAGMSHLILRFREKGLLDSLMELVRKAPENKPSLFLETNLTVEDNGYWANHFDFGKTGRNLSKRLIGQSRAAVIIINVLLPFACAWGNYNNRQELSEKAVSLFRTYPSAPTNTIERHMKNQLGLKQIKLNRAGQQQGLIHLYRKYCTQGRCGDCLIGGNHPQSFPE